MDVALVAAGLAAEVERLLVERDFEGAETLLINAFADAPVNLRAFLHLQHARVYREWNKLTSAVNHLHRALELGEVDPFLKLQIMAELQTTRARRDAQRP